jgi:hypothetical protein
MKFFKIIKDKEFIGVGTTRDMRRFQKKHNVLLVCDENEAQYIQCNEVLYHATWMEAVHDDSMIADVIRIEEDEYNCLLSAIESNDEIKLADEPVVEYEPVVDEVEELTVDYIRSAKLAELKHECNKAITEGFDMELGDGATRHFTLSMDDQISLLTQAYFDETMKSVVIEMNGFKAKHMAHLKELEEYVNSLNDIKEISKVAYRKEDA